MGEPQTIFQKYWLEISKVNIWKVKYIPVAFVHQFQMIWRDHKGLRYSVNNFINFRKLNTWIFLLTSVSARCRVPYAVEENLRGMNEWKNDRQSLGLFIIRCNLDVEECFFLICFFISLISTSLSQNNCGSKNMLKKIWLKNKISNKKKLVWKFNSKRFLVQQISWFKEFRVQKILLKKFGVQKIWGAKLF